MQTNLQIAKNETNWPTLVCPINQIHPKINPIAKEISKSSLHSW